MKKANLLQFAVLFLVLFLLASCAKIENIEGCVTEVPYGFGYGLLHGIIAPFVFIISLFKDGLAIYAVNNTGAWYDFGYLMGMTIIFGGGSRGAKRKK